MTANLRSGAISLTESVIMGVAGSAPGFSVSVALGALIATAGVRAPGALIYFALPMIGIAVAYKGLGSRMPHAGAGYEWAGKLFGKPFGFASGWALLVAAAVFIVTGSSPLGAATLSFFAPHLTGNVMLSTAIGTLWFFAISVVLMIGIGLTSKLQMVMTIIQLTVLTTVLVAAMVHAIRVGAVNPPSWEWFSLDYPSGTLASTALLVVFFYWGWDVTANLEEETHPDQEGGTGGFLSVCVTTSYFVAFASATLVLFSVREAQDLSDNLVYHIAEVSGLGRTGALAASFAVILSSVAAMETLLLQFSRTIFAMGRDGSLPRVFGVIHERTQTPMNAMYLILVLGTSLMFMASFMPSIAMILSTSVKAIALQVSFYYGLSGLACAFLYRDTWRGQPFVFLTFCLFPLSSAIFLGWAGIYSFLTFDTLTKVVGLGALLIGALFYRRKLYGSKEGAMAPSST
jgi:amino acid transporter